MWLWLLGCGVPGPPAPPAPWTALAWSDAGRVRHEALWRGLSDVPDDWLAPPVSGSEAYLSQWWCGPAVPEDACWTGAVARGETRGAAWRGLAAVGEGDGRPGQLVVDAGALPLAGDWGLALTLHLEADTGDLVDWRLDLSRWAGTRLTARLTLGPQLSRAVELTDFSAPGPDWAVLVGSADGFRQATTAAVEALQAEVDRGIAAHEVRRCAYGRYWGDGSPKCEPVALSPAEEAAVQAQVRTELSHQLRLVDQDAETLHRQLHGLLPATLAP